VTAARPDRWDTDLPKVIDQLESKTDQSERDFHSEYTRVFSDHPFYPSPELIAWLSRTFDGNRFKRILHLD
jgi:hypothetical protein